jgi:hypothetical protein
MALKEICGRMSDTLCFSVGICVQPGKKIKGKATVKANRITSRAA